MKNDKTLTKSKLEYNFYLLNSNDYRISSYHTNCIDYFRWCPIFVGAPFSRVPHFRWCPFFRWCPKKTNKKNEKLSLVPHFSLVPLFWGKWGTNENGAPLKMGHTRKYPSKKSVETYKFEFISVYRKNSNGSYSIKM